MLHTIISGIEKLENESEYELKSFSTIDYTVISNDEELASAFQNCDIFWFRLNHKITKQILKNSKCNYILCAATGLDHIDLKACEEYNIEVISLYGESEFLEEIRATAEHTLGLLLSLIRKSNLAFKHVEDGLWDRSLFKGSELYKKKVGILGMGRLGKIMAKYYQALGMDIYYYDILSINVDQSFHKMSTIEELFMHIDVLSIHLPYNEETHFLLDKLLLMHLKKHVFIVNTSRGGVINELDLLQLLKNEKIAGYATDVLFGEPDISNHPLVIYAKNNQNVLITPHISGNTYESIEKTEAFVLHKLIKKLNI